MWSILIIYHCEFTSVYLKIGVYFFRDGLDIRYIGICVTAVNVCIILVLIPIWEAIRGAIGTLFTETMVVGYQLMMEASMYMMEYTSVIAAIIILGIILFCAMYFLEFILQIRWPYYIEHNTMETNRDVFRFSNLLYNSCYYYIHLKRTCDDSHVLFSMLV